MLKQDGLLEDFRALRTEMMSILNARVWGVITYLALAGGVGAIHTKTNDSAIYIILIFAAIPLLWHTANRERSRVRIGIYIREIIEPQVPGLFWEHHLQLWRNKIPGEKAYHRFIDRWRHIFSLTGVYLLIVSFSTYLLFSKANNIYERIIGLIGVLLVFEAHLYFNRIFKSVNRRLDIMKETAMVLKDKDEKIK